MPWFKKDKTPTVKIKETKARMPDALWIKCNNCKEIIYKLEIERNSSVCPKCNYHFRIGYKDRLAMLLDDGKYEEFWDKITSADPLVFKDEKKYPDRLKEAKKKTGLEEAVLTLKGKIGGHDIMVCILEFSFLGGSMASAVGEKITRAIEKATAERCPLMIISCSGGARMQEGALSLMQMAKCSAALARLGKADQLFISLLTDPTTGGVTASFAMLGDIIIAEPRALIGFAGPRVIQDTIKQDLPPGFQRAEFLMDHGIIDMIVERKNLKETLVTILNFFYSKNQKP